MQRTTEYCITNKQYLDLGKATKLVTAKQTSTSAMRYEQEHKQHIEN
jgi:hypothetical protein